MLIRAVSLFALSFFFFFACATSKTMAKTPGTPISKGLSQFEQGRDPHSFAQPWLAKAEHLRLDLNVDFTLNTVSGTAAWSIKRVSGATRVIFDTRDLNVFSVKDGQGRALEFFLGENDPVLGAPLTIELPPGADHVTIAYQTSPQAAALQWTQPAQTAGGKHPFLFSQSQAILARSWIPCQDSPSVRFTYDATVKVPTELMAVMSAQGNPKEKNPDGVYHFSMPQAIPSYLMAIAVADLTYTPLGSRTGVYAEPSQSSAAAYELAQTEDMVEVAEHLFGPYRWGRYDMLLLPPSFPFGGMENPRLTFITPTMIAGDRSLVSLIAHELAHSWSGNLVTNATWNDFWLNEGFTVYIERRITEELYGRDYVDMLIDLGFEDLTLELGQIPASDGRLRLHLQGRDPDDGMTDVAYEKGYFFLTEIERAVGRKSFDIFLRSYFDRHAFTSISTDIFLHDLAQAFPGLKVDVKAWVEGEGLPPGFTVKPSARFLAVDHELKRWESGVPALELKTESWSAHEWIRFLRNLSSPDLVQDRLAELDQAFHFTQSGNAEILSQWLMAVIDAEYEPAYSTLEGFLMRVGRRKFLEPLYKELLKTPDGTRMARAIYLKARLNYHPVTVMTLDKLLSWP